MSEANPASIPGSVMKELMRGSAWMDLVMRSGKVLAVRVLGAGLGFAFNVVLARLLGASGIGVYSLAFTIAVVASVVGRVGLDTAMLKFAAKCYGEHDWSSLAAIHRMGMGVALTCSGIIALVMLGTADWVATVVFSEPALAGPLRIMGLAMVPFSLLNLYGELLKATHQTAMSAFVQGAAIPLINLGAIFLFANHMGSAQDATLIYLGATLVVLTLSYASWRGGYGKRVVVELNTPRLKELLDTAWPMYGASLAGILMTWADVLLLGVWASSAEVGVYGAAARTALLTSFFLMATNAVVAPRFAALHAKGAIDELAKLARRSAILASTATLPLVLLFILKPGMVLSVFGTSFIIGAQALTILAIGQFINAATGPVGYILNMSGLHKIESRISMLAALINIALCILLIPQWGILGAATANASAVILCNLARVGYVWKRLGILVLPLPASITTRLSSAKDL